MDKIITCIDGSSLSHAVCQAAVWMANKLDKSLLLLHAIEKSNTKTPEDFSGVIGLGARATLLNDMVAADEAHNKAAVALGKKMLEQAYQIASDQGCQHIEKTQRYGDIVEAIADLEADAHLIIIGRSGENHEKDTQSMGAHIEQVIRQVHKPVLIANNSFSVPKNFMLAYDGQETTDDAIRHMIENRLLHNLNCHLVTVKNGQQNLQQKFEETKALLIKNEFDVTANFLEGNVFDTLMNYKEEQNIDMLAMGAFSHSRLATVFLGSNTLKVMQETQLPLMILR